MAEEKELTLDSEEVVDDLAGEEKTSSRAQQKVELDLDDAPFLQEEEEEEEEKEEAPPEEKKPPEDAEVEKKEEERPGGKKKLIIIGGAALLVVVAVAAFFFFRGGEKKKPVQEKPKKEKTVKVKEKVPPPPPNIYHLKLRAFWVPYKFKDGYRFLHLTLVLSYDNDRVDWELKRKVIVIRDAIYYYLKNKDLDFMLNKKNFGSIKKDLIAIVDQYLTNGKLKDIYFQNYVIN